MAEIDWTIVGQVAGLGFLVLFIVVAAVAIAVWLVGLIIHRFEKRQAAQK